MLGSAAEKPSVKRFTKEGNIKSISINGISDFADGDAFAYDDEIVIIVHTFKNKGCEDITLVTE